MNARPAALALATALVILLSACSSATQPAAPGSSTDGSDGNGTITVLAAASLTDAFTQIGKDFEAKHAGSTVTFSFGSSATLATQIVQGAPADVFAAASSVTMETATAAGVAARRRSLVAPRRPKFSPSQRSFPSPTPWSRT